MLTNGYFQNTLFASLTDRPRQCQYHHHVATYHISTLLHSSEVTPTVYRRRFSNVTPPPLNKNLNMHARRRRDRSKLQVRCEAREHVQRAKKHNVHSRHPCPLQSNESFQLPASLTHSIKFTSFVLRYRSSFPTTSPAVSSRLNHSAPIGILRKPLYPMWLLHSDPFLRPSYRTRPTGSSTYLTM